jgi:hypothetical protein
MRRTRGRPGQGPTGRREGVWRRSLCRSRPARAAGRCRDPRHRSFRRSGEPVPFYDVLLVWRDGDGANATHGALRWAPKVGATRTVGARGPVWSRTSVALTAALSTATAGLQPRPARELDDPVDAVGPATEAARRQLAAPAPPTRAAAPEAGDTGGLPWIGGIAAVALVLAAAALALRRRSLRMG